MSERPATFQLQIRDLSNEVTGSVVQAIERYTVLLIHRRGLVGSGTLVLCNGIHGVLTAHHVPEKGGFDFRAGSSEKLGLCIDRRRSETRGVDRREAEALEVDQERLRSAHGRRLEISSPTRLTVHPRGPNLQVELTAKQRYCSLPVMLLMPAAAHLQR